ncbi:isoleucine--tRNA ligase [Spirosoma rhododendri]|uniref:Isoleucine--tRNA ligase n=1 Tax=Spirosoma rhododendri TaxID=2728024 RepID=A0A7L5DRX8_9BACT|nr:isoleucine--tRNA ligase [Spirosoma rhododendri]QJD81219.1 isoleucine--tRNA ligase [Spirosoma rhododendri]
MAGVTYQQYDTLDYAKLAAEVLTYWNQNQVFEQSVATRAGKPSFTFYEGPPSANGAPGIHHVMARTIKDIFCRYKTLQGFQVNRKGGWDTHGLPIELQVEKELGITKDDIGKTISVEEYNRRCRETVMRFTDQWNDLTQKMGYWVDLDNPYVTYKNEYIESVWWLLKQLYDQNLLYKGYTIQPFSPKAGTGLSSHELNQPGTYKDVRDTTIVAQFRVKLTGKSGYLFDSADSDDVFILAWTTTPWTLPANSALTVGKDIDYVLIKTFNAYTFQPINVVLAKALVSRWFNEKARVDSPSDPAFNTYQPNDNRSAGPSIPWAYVDIPGMKGEHLLDVEYEQLMPYVQPDAPAFRVIAGDFVTTEDGTGIVHTSPTFGADDFRVAQAAGIPAIMVKDETGKDVPVVDRQGRFVSEITDFAGRYVKEEYYSDEERAEPEFKPTDVLISIKLKQENKAFRVEKYEHPYPHCWRTDKPILYYPLDSWFIRTTARKDRLVALNKTINWQPESTGTGRFGNWLENLVDWNLSRSRYWGTPLPIWRSESGEEVCIGSIDELVSMSERANERMSELIAQGHSDYQPYVEKNSAFLQSVNDSTYDLHRPYSDEIYFVSESGKLMQREPDLIDVWFDSGAMPYAQWHYPFENKDKIDNGTAFPADFISEGVDQTRGWFFTLHAIAGMLFDSVAFKNVVSTGLVLDKNGNKMSKRLGNAVDPFKTLAQYGPDATRWYMITNAEPWDNLKFNLDGVGEVQRKLFGTLSNTYNFFALYANLDKFTVGSTNSVPVAERPELDRWILSKLQSLVLEVEGQFDSYNPTKAGRAVQDFVNDQLSNWYVRLSRRRFWAGSAHDGAAMTTDKQAAYETLYTCLTTVAQLMSPIAPFYADWLYRNLVDGETSVHLTDFPKADQSQIDADLETSMELAQQVSSLVHSLRKGHKLKVRQPLSRVLIPVLNATTRRQIEHVAPIIQSEVNVKEVEFIDDASGILKKKVKPNFKALGPRFGKQMKDVAAAITALTESQLAQLEQQGTIDLAPFTIQLSDVEILTEDIPGWLVASEGGLTVALDVTVTDELRREGIARDFVNRIQNLRKDLQFDVTDKITIEIGQTDAQLIDAIEANRPYIQQEVQAVSLQVVPDLNGASTEVEIDEFRLRVLIGKS